MSNTFASVMSATLQGLQAKPVRVEVDVARGFPGFKIVGLPDKAVEESRERIIAAIRNCGAIQPLKRSRKITVNLAPADLKKEGSLYDFPITVAYLLATKQINLNAKGKLFIGELSLAGQLRPVSGVLAVALLARRNRYKELFLPQANVREASLVSGIKLRPLPSLECFFDFVNKDINNLQKPKPQSLTALAKDTDDEYDLSYVKGQPAAKRALEIAAAGGHNLLLTGTPGTGKTFLARCLPSIMPPLSEEEALELTNIYSVAGLLPHDRPIVSVRPFRTPHHSASIASLVGGGSYPKPGEVTLAHRGILFLDELPEFSRSALENLRQPLEDGRVIITRTAARVDYPARFTLVAAMNPCPCGYRFDERRECVCSADQITRYQKKISGPLLDRIDMHITVPRVEIKALSSGKQRSGEELSSLVRKNVIKARRLQKKRLAKTKIYTNAEMTNRHIERYCRVSSSVRHILEQAADKYALSARGYFRILKVARTIADLAGEDEIKKEHIFEATRYRVGQQDNN